MIRVLCLNPVIDRVYTIAHFEAGKKFKEIEPDIFVGGKGVNIARVVSCLDEKCVLYAFIGGRNGRLVEAETASENIETRFVQIPQETRVTINVIDSANDMETEITELGPSVNKKERDALLALLINDIAEDDIVVCSGIAINGVENDIYRHISDICVQRNAKCIIDTNNQNLKQSLPSDFYFAKPNIDELKEYYDIDQDLAILDAVSLCRKMLCQGIENVLLTLGGDGGILVNRDAVLSIAIPAIKKESTIGSGDSTVAGLCVGLSRGMDIQESVRLALACGTSNATFKKIGFVTKESVAYFYDQIHVTPMDIQ